MGVYSPAPIEPAAIVLQCNSGGDFDHLSIGKVLLQFREQFIGYPLRGFRHGLGNFQSSLLGRGEKITPTEVQYRRDFVVGCAAIASSASIRVDSKGAANHGSGSNV